MSAPVSAPVSEQAIADAAAAAMGDTSLFSARLLAGFYAARDYRYAWDSARAQALLRLAEGSRAEGLEPDDFHAGLIRASLARNDFAAGANARTAADILFSDALLRYLHHLQFGKYNPRRINPGNTFTDPVDAQLLADQMHRALAAADLPTTIGAMVPQPPFYQQLKRGYQRYLALADRGDWQAIPAGGNLAPGSRNSRVALVRERLAVTDGYETPTGVDPDHYDESMVTAVKAFQGRSGLAVDGVIGPATLRALNHPLEDRLVAIRANLERMRWLYHDLPPDYIFVDITAFQVTLLRDHQPVWETRTVVGTTEHQTPMFRDAMEHLVFNPDWTMPPSIQKKQRGAGSRYQVIDRRTGRRVSGSVDVSNVARYRVVQPPGPNNALGKVKFMFPNRHAIYLHDTPGKHLFARGSRAYSHGCVRVQDPLTLAERILATQNWDRSAVDRVVGSGRMRYVHLDEHLPVLLYYLTALADEEGRVGFRQDIYGRDRALIAALDRPADAARLAFTEPTTGEEADDATAAQVPATVGAIADTATDRP